MKRIARNLAKAGSESLVSGHQSKARFPIKPSKSTQPSQRQLASNTFSQEHSDSRKLVIRRETDLSEIQDPENIILYEPLQRKIIGPYESKSVSSVDWLASTVATDFQAESVTAYVAFGSNLGDRVTWIERALKEMKLRGVKVKRTSSLWMTEPMYVIDQESFLNGVVEIETKLKPEPFLRLLQDVENSLGRHKVIDKGPRNIDLDILLYGGITYSSSNLTIPHALMLEREFVLRPLAELIPNVQGFYPDRSETASELLAALPKSEPPMYPVLQLGCRGRARSITNLRRNPGLRGILNATPDSFSDGGKLFEATSNVSPVKPNVSQNLNLRVTRNGRMSIVQATSDPFSDAEESISDVTLPPCDAMVVEKNQSSSTIPVSQRAIVEHVRRALRALRIHRPVSIFDVGGQSTAPGAPEVSAEEEIGRVIPVIDAFTKSPHKSLISIDTYRASVAEAALNAGAHIVNDVSAGIMDPEILNVVAEAGCSYILMHMRGTPATMSELTSYPAGLIPTIAKELLERIRAAEEAGIYRWRIMLDPGIGFAKTSTQNLEILCNFEQLRNYPGLENFAWVVGSSRKKFIGKVTGIEQPNQRAMGSMIAVAAAIQGGADIVRIHDLRQGVEAVKMADAIWRGWEPTHQKEKEDD